MKRPLLILTLGAAGAILAYCCVYLAGTAKPRAMLKSPNPELAWLQREFELGDAEVQRITELHAGYLPQCKERCRQIEEFDEKLSEAIASASEVTPEIESLLNERARIRAACQAEMLKHFLEVSRTMPSEQGKRYLAWAWDNTCLREQRMDHGLDHNGPAAPPPPHP